MMRRRKSSGRQPEPEINVTPLVDVVLVLLIIFMVVTPAMDQGEHIELPQLLKADEKKKDLNPIEVTLAFNGKLLVNKEVIEPSRFESKLVELHKAEEDAVVMLNADARLDYVAVRETFKTLQDIGFSGVSLKVEERKPMPGRAN